MSYPVGVALKAALDGLVAGRVYPVNLPDAPSYPCIRFAVVGSAPENTLCGEADLVLWRYRVDVYAPTVKECAQIAYSVKAVMRRFVFRNTVASELDGYEPETRELRRMLDFHIWEKQGTAPTVRSTARAGMRAIL